MLALLCTAFLLAQDPSPLTPRQFRVVWEEAPATEASIGWTTTEAGKKHLVHLDRQSRAGRVSAYRKTIKSDSDGPYSLSDDDRDRAAAAHFHHVHLTKLKPDTTYWFVITSDGEASRELHFRTAPDENIDISVLYGGDSRTGRDQRQVVNQSIADMAAADANIRCFIHGGDYIERGLSWWQWTLWLDHFQLTIGAEGMVLPIIPARGNHDNGPLFNEIFDRPGLDGKNYFHTDLTPEIALLTLNSEISAAGDQANWLEGMLGDLRANRSWLLAHYHRPAWPAIKAPGSGRTHWVPLFEQFDVDLVMESDGHCMKRTLPIRDGKEDPTGVTYIGEGGLGVPQRKPDSTRWFLQPPAFTGSAHHLTRIDFGASELRTRFFVVPHQKVQNKPADILRVRAQDAVWSYLAGSDPEFGWHRPSFDSSSWPVGPAGFGYADEDDATLLEDMRGNYERVYLRAALDLESLADVEELGILISYDDAFILYLNGVEMCRRGLEGNGAKATKVKSHEGGNFEYIAFLDWRETLEKESNVLAIEGHNTSANSSDFTLWPILVKGGASGESGVLGLEVVDDHRLQLR